MKLLLNVPACRPGVLDHLVRTATSLGVATEDIIYCSAGVTGLQLLPPYDDPGIQTGILKIMLESRATSVLLASEVAPPTLVFYTDQVWQPDSPACVRLVKNRHAAAGAVLMANSAA